MDREAARVQSEYQNVRDDMAQLRADFAELAEALLDASKAGATEARAQLEEEARRRLAQLKVAANDARARGGKAVAGVEEQIREKPLASVGIAFGVGLLLGKLFDRR